MALSPLTSQLPSLVGSLPDLFRQPDGPAGRETAGSTAPQAGTTGSSTDAPQRALPADSHATEAARLLQRRAVLGPLTYGRRAPLPADAPAAMPSGMRGALLDVRG